MTDLTKITTPFGLLDDETQAALMAYVNDGGAVQRYTAVGEWLDYDFEPEFYHNVTYRAKPLTLPKWPTGLLPKWKWIAMDEDGAIYLHSAQPHREFLKYWSSPGKYRIDNLIAISFDGIPWGKAVIERPEDEE